MRELSKNAYKLRQSTLYVAIQFMERENARNYETKFQLMTQSVKSSNNYPKAQTGNKKLSSALFNIPIMQKKCEDLDRSSHLYLVILILIHFKQNTVKLLLLCPCL